MRPCSAGVPPAGSSSVSLRYSVCERFARRARRPNPQPGRLRYSLLMNPARNATFMPLQHWLARRRESGVNTAFRFRGAMREFLREISPSQRLNADYFASFALGLDLEGTATNFTIRREPLPAETGVNDDLKRLAAERALDVHKLFHAAIYLRIGKWQPYPSRKVRPTHPASGLRADVGESFWPELPMALKEMPARNLCKRRFRCSGGL